MKFFAKMTQRNVEFVKFAADSYDGNSAIVRDLEGPNAGHIRSTTVHWDNMEPLDEEARLFKERRFALCALMEME